MQHKTRQDKTRQDKTRQDKTRQDKTRQDKTRQDKTRQDKTRQDKTRQDKTRQDKTKQDKTRQDKTRQDKTRQDKTRQDSTVQYSAVQYSTVQYSTKQYSTKQYSTGQDKTRQYITLHYVHSVARSSAPRVLCVLHARDAQYARTVRTHRHDVTAHQHPQLFWFLLCCSAMSSAWVSTDSLFKSAVNLPLPVLKEALLASQLDAPGVLRSYPQYTPEELVLVKHPEVDSMRAVNIVPTVGIGSGTADIVTLFPMFSSSASSPSLSISSSLPLSPAPLSSSRSPLSVVPEMFRAELPQSVSLPVEKTGKTGDEQVARRNVENPGSSRHVAAGIDSRSLLPGNLELAKTPKNKETSRRNCENPKIQFWS